MVLVTCNVWIITFCYELFRIYYGIVSAKGTYSVAHVVHDLNLSHIVEVQIVHTQSIELSFIDCKTLNFKLAIRFNGSIACTRNFLLCAFGPFSGKESHISDSTISMN